MVIGHSMDIVSMPEVPRCHTKLAKIRSIQAVDIISVLSGPIMQLFRKRPWPHNVFRFFLNGRKTFVFECT
jgi:hypothetical protein